jgi:hypothetical protein
MIGDLSLLILDVMGAWLRASESELIAAAPRHLAHRDPADGRRVL